MTTNYKKAVTNQLLLKVQTDLRENITQSSNNTRNFEQGAFGLFLCHSSWQADGHVCGLLKIFEDMTVFSNKLYSQ